MLVKLLPEQIPRVWSDIRLSVVEAYPPFIVLTEDALSNILKSLLIGAMDCWVIVTEEKKAIGIILTSFNEDFCSGSRSLNVYSMWSSGGLTKKIWLDGWNTLTKYAKGKGCSLMVGYTNVPSIINLFRKMGGEAEMTFLRMEV